MNLMENRFSLCIASLLLVGYLGQTLGRLMVTLTPAGFEGFFEEVNALSPQQQQEIPRVMEIAKKFGLEILPPPGA